MAQGIQFTGTNTAAVNDFVTGHGGTTTPLPEMAGRPPALLITHDGNHLITYPADYLVHDNDAFTVYAPAQIWSVYLIPADADLSQVNEYQRITPA